MSFAISDTLLSCRVLEEESLTSSQLSLSCTVQSFFSEATSCSALFSLAVGQGLAAVVQSQGYRFLSPLFSQKTAKILSTVASSITEGICFNTTSELARSGELQMGSFTENFHGIATILVCKAMGRGVLAHNAVVRNLVQNSALMAVDVTFEECGWIERRNFTLVERYFNCQLTSFRMEVSATFLGTVCPEVGILKAKLELDYELQKPGRKQSPSENRHWIDPFLDLFSPQLAGNHGKIFQNVHPPQREFDRTQPIQKAADLIYMSKGKRVAESIQGKESHSTRKGPTINDLEILESSNPEVARWVKLSLVAWHDELLKPENERKKYSELVETDESHLTEVRTNRSFELIVRSYLRSLSPPIALDMFYYTVLPVAIEFLNSELELASLKFSFNSFQQLNLLHPTLTQTIKKMWNDFFKGKHLSEKKTVDEFEAFLRLKTLNAEEYGEKAKAREIAVKFFPLATQILHFDFLTHIFETRMNGRKVFILDPHSPAYILMQAMAKALIGVEELKQQANIDMGYLLKQICEEREPDEIKDPMAIQRLKVVFVKYGVPFDEVRFFEKLHPNIRKIFPEVAQESCVIEMTQAEFEEARLFSLGRVMTAWRFDSYQADSHLTLMDISQKIRVKTDKVVAHYEMSVFCPVSEDTLTAIIDNAPRLKRRKRIVYLAQRPEIITIIPLRIIQEDGTRHILTPEEIEDFQKIRRQYLNTDLLRKEVRSALPGERRTVQDLEDLLRKYDPKWASKAEKFFSVHSAFDVDEIRALTRCLQLSFAKWVLHFHQVYTYFLGIDESAKVILPTQEELDQLHKIPPCSKKLIENQYKGKTWEELTLEQKWHLHLFELASQKFRNSRGTESPQNIAVGTGIAILKFPSMAQKSIISRSWPNETIAKYSNTLELDFKKRRQLFIYFRENLLRELLEDQSYFNSNSFNNGK